LQMALAEAEVHKTHSEAIENEADAAAKMASIEQNNFKVQADAATKMASIEQQSLEAGYNAI
jgi:hypothetical protein